MLGLPVMSWMRFFAFGFAAGLALFSIRFGPIPLLALIVMAMGLCGMLLVTIYTRYYAPREWRRWGAKRRRFVQTMARLPALQIPLVA